MVLVSAPKQFDEFWYLGRYQQKSIATNANFLHSNLNVVGICYTF